MGVLRWVSRLLNGRQGRSADVMTAADEAEVAELQMLSAEAKELLLAGERAGGVIERVVREGDLFVRIGERDYDDDQLTEIQYKIGFCELAARGLIREESTGRFYLTGKGAEAVKLL